MMVKVRSGCNKAVVTCAGVHEVRVAEAQPYDATRGDATAGSPPPSHRHPAVNFPRTPNASPPSPDVYTTSITKQPQPTMSQQIVLTRLVRRRLVAALEARPSALRPAQRRWMTRAPKPGDGPLMSRRADRELPGTTTTLPALGRGQCGQGDI